MEGRMEGWVGRKEGRKEGRREGGIAQFVSLISMDETASTARAGGTVENVLRLPKLVFRPFWFIRRRASRRPLFMRIKKCEGIARREARKRKERESE